MLIVHDHATNTGCRNRYDGLTDDEVHALERAICELRTDLAPRWRKRNAFLVRANQQIAHLTGE